MTASGGREGEEVDGRLLCGDRRLDVSALHRRCAWVGESIGSAQRRA